MEETDRYEGSAADSLVPLIGGPAEFVLMREVKWQSAVLNPNFDRTTVFGGRKVAWRRESSWTMLDGMERMQGDNDGEWKTVPQ